MPAKKTPGKKSSVKNPPVKAKVVKVTKGIPELSTVTVASGTAISTPPMPGGSKSARCNKCDEPVGEVTGQTVFCDNCWRKPAINMAWTRLPNSHVAVFKTSLSPRAKTPPQVVTVAPKPVVSPVSSFGASLQRQSAATQAPHVIVEARAGCLAAGTILNLNRAGRGFEYDIKRLTEQLSGVKPLQVRSDGQSRSVRGWDSSIPTRGARAVGNVIMLGTIKEAWCSGEKKTYTLKTASGKSIRATEIHPFLTADGEWKKLGELSVGGFVQVNGGRSKQEGSSGTNRQYQTIDTRYHPFQVHRGSGRYSVVVHHLVIESIWNDLPFHDYLYYLRSDPEKCKGFQYLQPEQIVHHKNEDPADNRLGNLEVLDSIKEHSDRHAWGNNVLWQVGYDKIVSIKPYGVEMTYDIEMASEPHNFLANGFVVHNTGKTTTLVEGLKVLKGMGSSLTPSEQQAAVWESMKLTPASASVCFCAFNKSIATELQGRVPPSCSAMTMHSLGLKTITKAYGRLTIDEYVVNDIIAELLHRDSRELRNDPIMSVVVQATKQLVGLCKKNLVDVLPRKDMSPQESQEWSRQVAEELSDLADYYDVDMEGGMSKMIYDLVPVVLAECLNPQKRGKIDFDDMIFLPVINDLPMWQYDLLLVDEAQDLCRCQQELALRAGKRLIFCGDPKQCQPAGTMVRVTGKDQPVPIESLKVGDHLVTFNPNGSNFCGKRSQGRKVEAVAHRQYVGDLYNVNGSNSTANHRWLTRFRPDVPSEYTAVYLVELPDGTYRIGLTQLVYGDGRGGFGPGMRARQRNAEKLWLLRVYETKEQAREAEYKNSIEFRIPQRAIYESSEDQWCKDLLDEGITSDIEGILERYKQFYEYPIWVKGDGQHIGKYAYVTQACNLIPDVNHVCTWVDGIPVWVPLDLSVTPDWEGMVYSLQVQPTERGQRLYISDNVVTHNSIYGFAGADALSMKRMKDILSQTTRGCQHLFLTVTRRCGKKIVEEARKIVPDFEAHPSNPEGKISYAVYPEQGTDNDPRLYTKMVNDGDMVLCRCNAPLVSQCFKFLKDGRKANIQGRDVGSGLISTVKKLCKGDDPHNVTVQDLTAKIEDWLEREWKKEESKRNPSEARKIALQDRHDCLLAFTSEAIYAADVIAKIESLFTDNRGSVGIRLSSIHRAKGLEADRVFFLQPKGAECPHPLAHGEWQLESESCLRYVACTRAREELVFVS